MTKNASSYRKNKKPHKRRQEQHKLQQNDGGKKPKKALSNCGTKEPKRRIEARLVEWQPQGKVSMYVGEEANVFTDCFDKWQNKQTKIIILCR